MAPSEHLKVLMNELCAKWSRCHPLASGRPKYEVFQEVLLKCESWISEEGAIDDLPSLNFHVAGAQGERRTLSVPAETYIVEVAQNEIHLLHEQLSVMTRLAWHLDLLIFTVTLDPCL